GLRLRRLALPAHRFRPAFLLSPLRLPSRFTLFPCTTLFRSVHYVIHLFSVITLHPFTGFIIKDNIRFYITSCRGRATIAFPELIDRKSTRLNSSHVKISYAVFCLKKKPQIVSELDADGHPIG